MTSTDVDMPLVGSHANETELQSCKRKFQRLEEDYDKLQGEYDNLDGLYHREKRQKLENAKDAQTSYNGALYLSRPWGEGERAVSEAMADFYAPMADKLMIDPSKIAKIRAVYEGRGDQTSRAGSSEGGKKEDETTGNVETQTAATLQVVGNAGMAETPKATGPPSTAEAPTTNGNAEPTGVSNTVEIPTITVTDASQPKVQDGAQNDDGLKAKDGDLNAKDKLISDLWERVGKQETTMADWRQNIEVVMQEREDWKRQAANYEAAKEKEIKQLEKRVTDAADLDKQKDGKIAELEKRTAESNLTVQNKDSEIEQLKRSATGHPDAIKQKENDIAELTKRVSEANGTVQNKDSEISDLKRRLNEAVTAVQQKDGEITSLSKRVNEAPAAVQQKDGEIQQLSSDLSQARNIVQQKDDEIKRLKELGNNVVGKAEAEMSSRDKQISELNESLSAARDQADQEKKAKDALDKTLETVRDTLADLGKGYNDRGRKLEEAKSENDDLEKNIAALKREVKNAKTKYDQYVQSKPLAPPPDDLAQSAADAQAQVARLAMAFDAPGELANPTDKSSAFAHEAYTSLKQDLRPGAKAVQHVVSQHIKKVRSFLSLAAEFEPVSDSASSIIDEMEFNNDPDYVFEGTPAFDAVLVPVLRVLLAPSTPRFTRSNKMTMAVRKASFQIRRDLLDLFNENKIVVSPWFVRSIAEVLADSLRLAIRGAVLRLREGAYRDVFPDPKDVNFSI